MPYTAQQIVTLATQVAKVPGYTSQAGQLLNMMLANLCQTFDFEAARKTSIVNVNTTLGSGPYPLPTDYLRMAADEVFYLVYGVPYVMVNVDLAEFDALVQQAGISNYPENFAVDSSAQAVTANGAPVMYVWPPSGGNYAVNIRYYAQIADITTPESSSSVPWFPNQSYLITQLAAELMQIAADSRELDYRKSASSKLEQYLQLQTDDEGRAKTVSLDRRRFGRSFNRLAQTKTLGWAVVWGALLLTSLTVSYHPKSGGSDAKRESAYLYSGRATA